MIKAIFIDIDGTLRDSNRNLSKKTIDTIKKVSEKGILVILCSGRPRKYTEQISRECFASKYIITSSGGNIYDYEQNKILYVNKMNKEALIELYKIANPEDVRFIMNVGEGRVVNKVKHPDQEQKLEENIENFVYKNDVVQCTIADSNFDKIKNLIPKIEKVENVEIKNRHKSLLDIKFKDDKTVFCDIANIKSNKGIAVKKLLEILNIKKEETIAIGDDNNDLSMFEQVGYKVAVSNAIDIVKVKADEITLSNDEDGVAVFLDNILKEINIGDENMIKEKYENWTKKFMESWKDLDWRRTLETLDKNVKYYENPIDAPCASFEEVINLWNVVADNQKDISYKFEIVSCNEKTCIINWQMTRTMTKTDTKQEIDGIFQISVNDEGKCIFFKQWRFTR